MAEKYEVVLTLEASVAELHQMFQDFALLTEQQGELLDQVENQVQAATDYVEDANVDVYEAIEYQNKIRNKLCCLISYVIKKNQRWTILIAVVIILIIAGIFTGVFNFNVNVNNGMEVVVVCRCSTMVTRIKSVRMIL